mgnify:FL=1
MTHLEKTEASTSKKSPTQKLFNKPPQWSFAILKLLTILIPLLSNTPDIQLNFYTVNILF